MTPRLVGSEMCIRDSVIPLMSEFSFSMRMSSSVSSMAFFHRARSSVEDLLLLPSVQSAPTLTCNKSTNTVLSVTFHHNCHVASPSVLWLHSHQLDNEAIHTYCAQVWCKTIKPKDTMAECVHTSTCRMCPHINM